MGYATKEMGIGTRHDAIEDRIDHHNFKKNINIGMCRAAMYVVPHAHLLYSGKTLDSRLRVAVDERNRQVDSYAEITSTLRKEVKHDWEKQVQDWEEDRSKPNPYAPRMKGMCFGLCVRMSRA